MVKRYDIDIEGDVEAVSFYSYESSSGDYVMFDDYESLAYEHDMLKDKYDTLVKILGELWREGVTSGDVLSFISI